MNTETLLASIPNSPKQTLLNGRPKGWFSAARKLERDGKIIIEERYYPNSGRNGATNYYASKITNHDPT